MNQKRLIYVAQLIALFLVYVITARFGLQMDAVSGFATLVWLPTGISLACLLIFGIYLWPAVMAGAFIANFFTHAPPLVALGISIGNTLEAVIAAYILKKSLHLHKSLDSLKDVMSLVLIGAVLSTAVSASIGVISLLEGNIILPSAIQSTWTAWWIGDMVSNLIVAPMILVWYSKRTFNLNPLKIIEKAVTLLVLLIIGSIIFGGVLGIDVKSSPLTYLVYPPIIWIALRFTQYETVTAIALFTFIAIWGTSHGIGPFIRPTLNESLMYLQSFIGVTSVTAMILAATVAERRQVEKQKNSFVSIASHELKTPITSIKAYSQLLEKTFTSKKNKQVNSYLRKMNVQINKLTRLVNDLLDLSRAQTGKLEFKKEKFSLQDLILDTAELIERIHRKYRIIVKGTVRRKVYGDEERIEQVLTNLILNAIKYSPKANKVVVTMKQEKYSAIVSVKDFGIGIAEEHHHKIFEYFYRVDDVYTRTLPGTGIGLFLSKNIVAGHGGKMWVESTPGEGSIFYFTLPFSNSRS